LCKYNENRVLLWIAIVKTLNVLLNCIIIIIIIIIIKSLNFVLGPPVQSQLIPHYFSVKIVPREW